MYSLIKKLFIRFSHTKNDFVTILKGYGMCNELTIFDVGAHLGQTSLFLNKTFKNSALYSFEPSPDLFDKLSQNIQKKNISLHNFALGNSDQEVFLSRPSSDLCGQIIKEKTPNSVKVYLRKLDNFCKDYAIHSIDLLKLDVEGNELDVLDGAKNLLEQNLVKAILLECDFNPQDTQHSYFIDVFNYLKNKNFCFHGLDDSVRYSASYGIGFCNALFLNSTRFD